MRSKFRGNYSHTIDAKGRVIIPAKFREPLGESFVVTKGFDGCLYAFAQDGWDAFDEQLQGLAGGEDWSQCEMILQCSGVCMPMISSFLSIDGGTPLRNYLTLRRLFSG